MTDKSIKKNGEERVAIITQLESNKPELEELTVKETHFSKISINTFIIALTILFGHSSKYRSIQPSNNKCSPNSTLLDDKIILNTSTKLTIIKREVSSLRQLIAFTYEYD